jgi:hypothetical protein
VIILMFLISVLSIIPSLHIAHPRHTARSSSHAISLTACGTMDKKLIRNQLSLIAFAQSMLKLEQD